MEPMAGVEHCIPGKRDRYSNVELRRHVQGDILYACAIATQVFISVITYLRHIKQIKG